MPVSMSNRRPTSRGIGGIVLVLAAALSFSGCWVTSINPLYEESRTEISTRDPDLIFEPSLLGAWVDHSDKCGGVTLTSKDGETYDLQAPGRTQGCTESDRPSHLQGRLVKLDSHYFMDIFPAEEDVCNLCLPQHNIFLAQFDKSNLSLIPIDSNWFKRALADHTVTLATLADDTDTITASSKDLKAFCRKYAENKEVFKTDSTDAARLTRK